MVLSDRHSMDHERDFSGYVLFVTGNTGHGIMGNMMNAVLFINLTMLVSTGISTAWKLHHRGK